MSDRLILFVRGEPGGVRNEFYRGSPFTDDLHFGDDSAGTATVFSLDLQKVVAHFQPFRQIKSGGAFPVIPFSELLAIYRQ